MLRRVVAAAGGCRIQPERTRTTRSKRLSQREWHQHAMAQRERPEQEAVGELRLVGPGEHRSHRFAVAGEVHAKRQVPLHGSSVRRGATDPHVPH